MRLLTLTKIQSWHPEQSPVLLVDPRAIRYVEPAMPVDAPGSKIFMWVAAILPNAPKRAARVRMVRHVHGGGRCGATGRR